MATLAVCKIMEEAEHSPPNFPHSSEIYMVVVQHKVGFEKIYIQSNGYVITSYLFYSGKNLFYTIFGSFIQTSKIPFCIKDN